MGGEGFTPAIRVNLSGEFDGWHPQAIDFGIEGDVRVCIKRDEELFYGYSPWHLFNAVTDAVSGADERMYFSRRKALAASIASTVQRAAADVTSWVENATPDPNQGEDGA